MELHSLIKIKRIVIKIKRIVLDQKLKQFRFIIKIVSKKIMFF